MTIKNLIALSGVIYIYNVTTIQITTVAIKSLISSIIYSRKGILISLCKIDSAHHSQKRKRNRNNKY